MKNAPGIVDDLVKSDFQTFPRDDPAELQRKAKLMVEQDKLRKEEEREKKAEATAAKKAAATKPAAVAKDEAHRSKDESTKAGWDRLKVKLYYQHRGDQLSTKEPKNLAGMGAQEVADLRALIEGELQSQGGIEVAANLFINASGVLEMVNQQFNPLGLQLSGPAASFSATIASNRKVWDDVLTEFAISNAEWFMFGPGKRLFVLLLNTVRTVDGANKAAIASMIARERPVSAKEKEESESL